MKKKSGDEVADEVIEAFAKMYPRLALPFQTWQTLREMIQREVDGQSAKDLLTNEDYKTDAFCSGLAP